MAIPDYKTKRAALYSDRTTPEERHAMADEFLASERYSEALELLETTKDPGRLDRVRAAARDLGDTFLLLRVQQIAGEDVPPATWREIAKRAEERGKLHDAYRALGLAGDEEQAEEFREKRIPDYRPFRPEGK